MTKIEIVLLSIWMLVGASLFITSLELFTAWLHLRRRRPLVAAPPERTGLRRGDSEEPLVSILKPLCGLEDGLEENLRVFASLDHRFEVIFSVADESDPVIALVSRIMADHPDTSLKLIVGERDRAVANPKVERLMAAERHARGEILMISDAQVRLRPADLETMIATLRDRSIGCVSHLFVGRGARNLGALLESTHLLSFVLAGNAVASFANVPCLVGKSMALRRDALRRIGGFAAFADVLAEDQAMAVALRKQGYRLALAPTVVANHVERKRVRASVDRQIRWNKIRYSFSRRTYASEFLAAPGGLALTAAAATLIVSAPLALAGLLAAAFARSAQVMMLGRVAGADNLLRVAALAPLQDAVQLGAWIAPLLSDEVNWRGTRARLGRGTTILPLEPQSA